jgi:hypothetical protein
MAKKKEIPEVKQEEKLGPPRVNPGSKAERILAGIQKE